MVTNIHECRIKDSLIFTYVNDSMKITFNWAKKDIATF
jgi:hypothetical protein